MLKLLSASAAVLALASGASAGQIGTVFYIAMENHNWTQPSSYTSLQQIKGNSAAPFINSLVTPGNANAQYTAYSNNYIGVTATTYTDSTVHTLPGPTQVHPSEPNYVWQESGVTGPLNDSQPYPINIVNAPNLTGVLQSAGKTWKSYQEGTDLLTTGGANSNSLSGSGKTTLTNTVESAANYTVPLTNFSGTSATYTNDYNGSHQFDYAVKHNPMAFFADTNGAGNAANYAPLQQLSTDLTNNTVAQYNWITPDQFNDMHTGLAGGFTYNGVHYTGDAAKIAQGDNFLSIIVPLIEASAAFQNNGEIVIWNDETEGDTPTTKGQYTSMEIVISKLSKGNAYASSVQYDHSNDLKTVQDILGVSGTPLGAAASAGVMADLYKAGAVPEPKSWAMMLVGLGLIGGALRRRGKAALAAA